MDLVGKVALVTGGAQGLGKAFSQALLKRGARVCLGDVKVDQGEATAKALRVEYGENAAVFVKCDVTNEGDMNAAFQFVKSTFGALDIVVNNAGIADEKNWPKMVDINLKGVMWGTNLAIEHMARDKGGNGGVVINVASLAGIMPAYVCPAYVASKYGVVGFTSSWATNPYIGGMGLRFAALCPSFADTDIINADLTPNNVLYREDASKLRATIGVMKVEKVVEGFMQLVEDEDSNGAVMSVTPNEGIKILPPAQPTPV